MTLRFKWFSRMVPPGFKLVYSFTSRPKKGWSLWWGKRCLDWDGPVSIMRKQAWQAYYAMQPLPEVQE